MAVEQDPMGYYSDYCDENDNDDHDRGEFYSFYHYKKKNIIQQVLLRKKKKNWGNIYTIASLDYFLV